MKRTLEVVKRSFNVKWGTDFFIVEPAKQLMKCLICSEVNKTIKGYAKQHFRRHEKHPYARLQRDARKVCVENLKRNFSQPFE